MSDDFGTIVPAYYDNIPSGNYKPRVKKHIDWKNVFYLTILGAFYAMLLIIIGISTAN